MAKANQQTATKSQLEEAIDSEIGMVGKAEGKILRKLEELNWENTFVDDLPGDTNEENFVRIVRNSCYSKVQPSVKLSDPKLVAASEAAAIELLQIDPAEFERPEFIQVFAGGFVPQGCAAYAQCYGGHQFGHWAGQLGDGRAITLGEVVNSRGERWEVQLKGAGKTPYSRMADGRAVLRSSIREFIASEAMVGLGIPTTRALSIIMTGEDIMRDMFYNGNAKWEPGAVVCRLAPTFLRFGSFQLPASRGGLEKQLVRRLLDYTIAYHFPHLQHLPEPPEDGEGAKKEETEGEEGAEEKEVDPTANKYTAWFAEVGESTGRMIAGWQAVGFTHGVMNTDNMSVLGLTIDYGPFGFLDAFDPTYTPNTTDLPGRRYCFQNQPDVGLWNIVQLANALLTAGVMVEEEAQYGITRYAEGFTSEYHLKMSNKLGLLQYDKDLTQQLLRLMAASKVDFTNFFRKLSCVVVLGANATEEEMFRAMESELGESEDNGEEWKMWLRSYSEKLKGDDASALGSQAEEKGAGRRSGVKEQMDRTNPCYIPRNWLCQKAIEAAEAGDFSEVQALHQVMMRPYEQQEGMERFWDPPPPELAKVPGICVLSCSS